MDSFINKIIIFPVLILVSCSLRELKPEHGPGTIDWTKRAVDLERMDSLVLGETYLSIYTQIYSSKEKRTLDLTAKVSIRNTNSLDSIYLENVKYYNTEGELIRAYNEKPAYIAPMETIEIVLSQDNLKGGSGANFLFYWRKKKRTPEPYFEAVMISTSGQQGISFTTQGRRIK